MRSQGCNVMSCDGSLLQAVLMMAVPHVVGSVLTCLVVWLFIIRAKVWATFRRALARSR